MLVESSVAGEALNQDAPLYHRYLVKVGISTSLLFFSKHNLLQEKAHSRNSAPAYCAEQKRLAAALYELHEIAVQADRSHGHDDAELGQFL